MNIMLPKCKCKDAKECKKNTAINSMGNGHPLATAKLFHF